MIETSKPNSLADNGTVDATECILENGYGLREWAKINNVSIGETYDGCLKEIANDIKLRESILCQIDHSAARVYYRTGDGTFDRYVGTVLAMQTLCCGIDKRGTLEHLSMELLDAFLDHREKKRVTRDWLSQLLSNTYRTHTGVYRFGELTRVALMAALLLNYHDGDPIFLWALENRTGIETITPRQWSRVMSDALLAKGYPSFDFMIVRHDGRDIVRKVDMDTDSQFCRRLLRGSMRQVDNWIDVQHVNGPFFNEFVQSLGFTPTELSDFSDDTFERQARWFKDKPGPSGCTHRFLRKFYQYVSELRPDGWQGSHA